jgi:hypothetical protein
MKHFSIVIIAAATTLATAHGVGKASDPRGLVVHEWGTFTSIAGEDGRAVRWLPQSDAADLPCFVERVPLDKSSFAGTVRMETPVIYFYPQHEMTVNVSVRFRQGVLTEWYPRPASADIGATRNGALEGTLTWPNVKLMPGAPADFAAEGKSNHYYVARQTDASPLQSGSENERFLFYRGVGRLPPPITAVVAADGKIIIRNPRGDALGDLMLFDNRDGHIGYEVRHSVTNEAVFDLHSADDEAASDHSNAGPQAELERMLVARGLFSKEARAMVDSWRDSWFEHGARLFYIASGPAIDSILPLNIQPEPTNIVRVFVGRMELITPATVREVRDAVATSDWVALARYGRFLQPIAERLLANASAPERHGIEQRLQAIYSSQPVPRNVCN